MGRIEVGRPLRSFPASRTGLLEVVPAGIDVHHDLREAGDTRNLSKVRVYPLQFRLRRLTKVPWSSVKTLVAWVCAGTPHLGNRRLDRASLVCAQPHDGSGSRTTVFAVMTVYVDGARQVARRFDNSQGLLAAHAVVADGQVDIPQSVLPSAGDIRTGAVHRDNRLDSKLVERLESRVSLGTAAAHEVVGEAENVIESGGLISFVGLVFEF